MPHDVRAALGEGDLDDRKLPHLNPPPPPPPNSPPPPPFKSFTFPFLLKMMPRYFMRLYLPHRKS